jgi:helix-turn-helix protein
MRADFESSSGRKMTVVSRSTHAGERLENESEPPNSQKLGVIGNHGSEPFIDPGKAAQFVQLNRKTILRFAREGSIPAHPLSGDKRRIWRFLLSELDLWARSKVNSTCDRCQNSRSK